MNEFVKALAIILADITMCSITESALDPAMAVSRLSLAESSVCKKCPSREVAVVLRGKDVYCRQCLLLGVQHKMRATLGKHKGMLHKAFN